MRMCVVFTDVKKKTIHAHYTTIQKEPSMDKSHVIKEPTFLALYACPGTEICPVVQGLIKPRLEKILIAIYLPLKGGFPQNCGPVRL